MNVRAPWTTTALALLALQMACSSSATTPDPTPTPTPVADGGQEPDGAAPDDAGPKPVRDAGPGDATVPTTSFKNASTIAASKSFTCALTTAGGVKCWGDNTFGQLGNGTSGAATSSLVPVAVTGLANVVSVVAGQAHACALTRSGGVKCWGSNQDGQRGNGSNSEPNGPTDAVGLGSGVEAISAGSLHTCAVLRGGALKCWGTNTSGEIAKTGFSFYSTPQDVTGIAPVASLSAANTFNCIAATTGSASCWGSNSNGNLGIGGTDPTRTPTAVFQMTTALTISGGGYHACAVLQGGEVKCWGNTPQLGFASTAPRYTYPVSVPSLESGVLAVSAGATHTCARKADGTVACWGVLNGTKIASATAVAGLAGVTDLSSGTDLSCARTSAGVSCWGKNDQGQLGDQTQTPSDAPVAVLGL